jgi:hypothetical protein
VGAGALCAYLDGEAGVGEKELELRGDEGSERRAGCGGGRGGVGGRRHRRRRRWLAMDSAGSPFAFFFLSFGSEKVKQGGIGLLICLWSVVGLWPIVGVLLRVCLRFEYNFRKSKLNWRVVHNSMCFICVSRDISKSKL